MKNRFVVLLAIGIVLVALAAFQVGWNELATYLRLANPVTMGFLLLLQVATLILLACPKWFLLRKANSSLTLGRVLAINLAGSYIESVTPSAKFGGETARMYLLRRYTSFPYTQLAGIQIALTYMSLVPFLALATGAVALGYLYYRPPFAALAALAIVALLVAGLAWFHHMCNRQKPSGTHLGNQSASHGGKHPAHQYRHTRTVNRLESFAGPLLSKTKGVVPFLREAALQSRNLMTRRERHLMILVSALVWALYPAKVYVVTRMLGIDVDALFIISATFIPYLISMLPLLPGGLGSFEGSMALLFAAYGATFAEGLAVALLTRTATFWFPLLISTLAAAYLFATHVQHGSPGDQVKRSLRGVLPFFDVARRLERLAVSHASFSGVYERLFYRRTLARELRLADLRPGASILNIGCGPFPYTALFLAEQGFQVEAVDCDAEAVTAARSLLKRRGFDHAIRITHRDASQDGNMQRRFDAVWISLNVHPKHEVLQRALNSLNDDGRLIVRELPLWMSGFFPPQVRTECCDGYITDAHGSPIEARSILLMNQSSQGVSYGFHSSSHSANGEGRRTHSVAGAPVFSAVRQSDS